MSCLDDDFRAFAVKAVAQLRDDLFLHLCFVIYKDPGEAVVTDADQVRDLVLEEVVLAQHHSLNRVGVQTGHSQATRSQPIPGPSHGLERVLLRIMNGRRLQQSMI